jgi:hypothetical protein
LRAIVNFYVMGVGIYDEKPHEVRLTSYGESVMRSKNGKLDPSVGHTARG